MAIDKSPLRSRYRLPRRLSAAICCGGPPLRLGGGLCSSVPQRCPGKLVEVPNLLKSLG